MEKMTLIGNLGAGDTQGGTRFKLNRAKNGEPYVNASVATHWGKGQDKVTTWWRVRVWGVVADNFAKYMQKGSKVYIEGVPQKYIGYVDSTGGHYVEGMSEGPKVPVERMTLRAGRVEYLDPAPKREMSASVNAELDARVPMGAQFEQLQDTEDGGDPFGPEETFGRDRHETRQ